MLRVDAQMKFILGECCYFALMKNEIYPEGMLLFRFDKQQGNAVL